MSGTLSINSLAVSLERTLPRVFQRLPRNSVRVSISSASGCLLLVLHQRPHLFRDLNMIDYKKTKMLPFSFLTLIFMCIGITHAIACTRPSKESVLSSHAMDSGHPSRSMMLHGSTRTC